MTASRILAFSAILAGNYLFLVARHEGCHALAATLTGAVVLDVHLWPPRGGNLSWITILATRPRAPWEIQLQALAPYAMSLLIAMATLHHLSSPAAWTPSRRNLALTGVVFPLLDLSLGVGTYGFSASDFRYVFGPPTRAVKIVLGMWVGVLAALWAAIVLRVARS